MTVDPSEFRVGDRLKPRFGWKSLAPIYRGDELIAFLGMHSGYRGKWAIYPITEAAKGSLNDGYTTDGYRPSDGRSAESFNLYGVRGSTRAREKVPSAMAEMFNADLTKDWNKRRLDAFRTISEQKAALDAHEAETRAQAAKWRMGAEQLQNARVERLRGLQSIRESNSISLDDAQRDALTATITMLEAEVRHYQRQLDNPQT
jgi:hypothetical protein